MKIMYKGKAPVFPRLPVYGLLRLYRGGCRFVMYSTVVLACAVEVTILPTRSAMADTATPVQQTAVANGWQAAKFVQSTDMHTAGFGQFDFLTRDGKRLTAYFYRASDYRPTQDPIWFVMHGAKRNAEAYLQAAAPVAERYKVLAVAIEFSRQHYPTGSDYTLGVLQHGKLNEQAYRQGRWRAADDYLYVEIERVFEALQRRLSGRQTGYYLFGHSAGAQFSHRLLTFMPQARVLGAVAANAGWYTLPGLDQGAHLAMPYGLRGSPLQVNDLKSLLRAPLIVLLGELDTASADDDPLLRDNAQANRQGKTRLERGKYYFAMAKARAEALGVPFGWRLVTVPGAGHDIRQMVASAGFLLFASDSLACRSSLASEAQGLQLQQVSTTASLTDKNSPFVEFINRGAAPLCLTGWTLTDTKQRQRHLFPIGRALAPAQTIRIIDGIMPIGRMDKADVQAATARNGLGLTKPGDVLILRDVHGRVVKRFAWEASMPSVNIERRWAANRWLIDDHLDTFNSIVFSSRKQLELARTNFSPGVH